ncbi:MAG: hypothetical protein AAFO82_01710 [Bacteroidota bacterium]
MNDKKVNVKYYTKRTAKPDLMGAYPVYMRVTYDRETTHIKAHSYSYPESRGLFLIGVNNGHEDDSPEFKQLIKELNSKVYFNENAIEEVVRFEADIVSNNYSVKGLGQRLQDIYLQPIDILVNIPFIMKQEFKDSIPVRLYFHMTYELTEVLAGLELDFLYHLYLYYEEEVFAKLSEKDVDLILGTYLVQAYSSCRSKTNDYHPLTPYEWLLLGGKEEVSNLSENTAYSKLVKEKMKKSSLLKHFGFDLSNISKYVRAVDNLIYSKIKP